MPSNFIKTSDYGNNYVDFNELINTTKDIIVDSFVQKADYYTPYITELRKLFNIKKDTIDDNHLALHIRETDYSSINCFLGYNFYKKIIIACNIGLTRQDRHTIEILYFYVTLQTAI